MAKRVSPFLKEFVLEPLRGSAPLSFGMERDEVLEKMEARGCALSARKDTQLLFFQNSILVELDETGRTQFIEFRASEDLSVSYRAINVFDTPAKEVAKAIALNEPEPQSPIEMLGTKLFPAQIISLYEADKQYDHWGSGARSIWSCVGIGNQTYFQAVAEKPWVPPPRPAGVERFVHAKFGPASLVSRTGNGPEATLELVFDDGVTRRLKASFVKPTDS